MMAESGNVYQLPFADVTALVANSKEVKTVGRGVWEDLQKEETEGK